MLNLHLIDGMTLIGYLVLEEFNFILKLMILFLQVFVLILKGNKFLKNVGNMLFGG